MGSGFIGFRRHVVVIGFVGFIGFIGFFSRVCRVYRVYSGFRVYSTEPFKPESCGRFCGPHPPKAPNPEPETPSGWCVKVPETRVKHSLSGFWV